MKKKLIILLLLLVVAVTFVACEKKYVPDPAVEQYLSVGLTAEGAYDRIAKVHYTTNITVQDKQGNILGTNDLEVEFDKSGDAVYYRARQIYSGSFISGEIEEVTATITKEEDGYVYDTVTHYRGSDVPIHKAEPVQESFVLDLVTALVYVDNGAYDEGGLYYGDFFMQRIYRYPARSFYVDGDLCVFDEKMKFSVKGVGDVRLDQTIKIDRFGLVMYFYERYESLNKDYVMISETVPTYVYTAAE